MEPWNCFQVFSADFPLIMRRPYILKDENDSNRILPAPIGMESLIWIQSSACKIARKIFNKIRQWRGVFDKLNRFG
jgi:hypothetical protein